MPMIKERLYKLCDTLKSYTRRKAAQVENIEITECAPKNGHTPPKDGWEPNRIICGAHKHYWLRASFTTPEAAEGSRYILCFSTGVGGRDMLNPQGILYLNGNMVTGVDTNHMEAFLEPATRYEMYLYLYTAYAAVPFCLTADIELLDIETEGLYYDMSVPLEALYFYDEKTNGFLNVLNENSTEYKDIISVLERCSNLIDIRYPYSEEYYDSIKKARLFLADELYEKLCTTEGKPVVHCVGHTHIDVEWRWERMQTREKVQRSIATAQNLMARYPEYKFTLTQPELYRYIKEEIPEKYDEIKRLSNIGRWEPEGAVYVECDCNLVSGESLIRQILYGKRFFKEEFGVDSKILFLPDVFGYSAAMPQILKKSGIDYFVTSKISWNEKNTLPYDSFMWRGIDGTEIFSSFITAQQAGQNRQPACRTTYSALINAPFAAGTWDRYQQKEYNKNTVLTYGYGDGGGGPTRDMLERQRRLAYGLPGLPVTRTSFLLDYLRQSEKEFMHNSKKLKRTPYWAGELYLEYHRGTYTTMAKNKRYNRKAEFLLNKAEALSCIHWLNGGEYASDILDSMWKTVLHDQFHDILPGTCIKEVYDHTDNDYKEVFEQGQQLVSDKLQALAANVNTVGGILVYNPLGFPRSGAVRINGEYREFTDVIPSLGWKVIKNSLALPEVQTKGFTAENEYYKLTLKENGCIASLYDKKANRQVFDQSQNANLFSAYEDMPYSQYEAWDIADYYRSKQYPIDGIAEISVITDGSRGGFEIKKTYAHSLITQKIWLYSKSCRIDFETEVDWHEKHQLLKVEFPLNVCSAEAVYEIQYGHVHRPTHENTSWDGAKFEVCGHKWADISEYGYGTALLNDCKYGYGVRNNTLELTVLKRPTYPNPDADEGMHYFTYSVLPHKGDFREAGVIREAYALNQPVEWVELGSRTGCLPEEYSLISCNNDNVIIETVKQSESRDGMIVRLYDSFNCKSTAEISLGECFSQAFLCDMMENELENLNITDNKVSVPVNNFEIVTVKFKK